MSEIRRGTVSLPGADIHCEEAGSGQAVLLLHAGVADHRMWHRQLEATQAVTELAEHLKRNIPHAEARTLAGTAHLPPLEVPEDFSQLLLDWLSRLPD